MEGEEQAHRTACLGSDEILGIAAYLEWEDLFSLRLASRFFQRLLNETPTVWSCFSLGINGEIHDPGGSRTNSLLPYMEGVCRLGQLLALSHNSSIDVTLETKALRVDQYDRLIAAFEPHGSRVHSLCIISSDCLDLDTLFLDYALYHLPNLIRLDITEYSRHSHAGVDRTNRILPASWHPPRLEHFSYKVDVSFSLQPVRQLLPLMGTIVSLTIEMVEPRYTTALFIRTLLEQSKGTAQSIRILVDIDFTSEDFRSPWQDLALPMLRKLELGAIEDDDGMDYFMAAQESACGFFKTLHLPSLRRLKLQAHFLPLENIDAPNLRELSYSPWEEHNSSVTFLSKRLHNFSKLEVLEYECVMDESERRRSACSTFTYRLCRLLAESTAIEGIRCRQDGSVALPNLQVLKLTYYLPLLGPRDSIDRLQEDLLDIISHISSMLITRAAGLTTQERMYLPEQSSPPAPSRRGSDCTPKNIRLVEFSHAPELTAPMPVAPLASILKIRPTVMRDDPRSPLIHDEMDNSVPWC